MTNLGSILLCIVYYHLEIRCSKQNLEDCSCYSLHRDPPDNTLRASCLRPHSSNTHHYGCSTRLAIFGYNVHCVTDLFLAETERFYLATILPLTFNLRVTSPFRYTSVFGCSSVESAITSWWTSKSISSLSPLRGVREMNTLATNRFLG